MAGTCAARGFPSTIRRTLAVLTVLSFLMASARPSAQIAPGGSISGRLVDAQGRGLGGVEVTVVSPADPAGHKATSDHSGYYRILNLMPVDYAVAAELTGFSKVVRENVVVREGLNINLDLTLTVGPISESITVVADTPMLEWKTPTTTAGISGDLQRALPLSGLKTWSDFLLLTPGMVSTQARFQTYGLHGTAQSSGVFLVDGADATSVIQGSTLYSQFSSETFRDIQVKTGAVDAASPLGLGPVVNIATQSGTGEWHGTARFDYQPAAWNADNAPGGQSQTVGTRQTDLSIGGPLARDRAWLFGSFRFARNRTGTPRSAQQVSYLRALAPAFEPFDNRWDGQIGFVKVHTRLSGHRILASYSRDVLTLGGAQSNEAGAFRNIVSGGPGYFGRISSVWGSSLMTRASAGYNGKAQRIANRQPAATGVVVYQDVIPVGGGLMGSGLLGVLGGSPFPGADYREHMWTIAGDATYFRRGWMGSHEFQMGAYLQPVRHNEQLTSYNNDGYQLEEAVLRDRDRVDGGFVPFHRQVYGTTPVTTAHVVSRDTALYVQDAWQAASRLTMTAGLRVDFVKRVDRLVEATTQRSVEVGPRVGINYILTSDWRTAVRVSWGRVHENLSVNETQGGVSQAGFVDLYDTGRNGSFSTVFATPSTTGLARDLVIDLDHYHQAHVDELIAGFRRQLPGQATVDVSLIHRAYRDRPAAVEINGLYNGNVFSGYRDPTQNEVYRLTSNIWNWPVATALQVQAEKRTKQLQFLASYTRERNHLAGTWQPNDPASFIQPGAFANENGIGYVDGCTSGPVCVDANSFAGVPGSGTWRSHVANVGISYQAPAHLLLATSYNVQSGPWSGPILTLASTPESTFGPQTVTLPNGRVVSNPLATPIRFAYPTRGEGQIQLPAVHLWNVRVAHQLQFASRRWETALDVLNVTNRAADQAFQYGGNLTFTPFFGQGATRQFPRAVQLSGRFMF